MNRTICTSLAIGLAIVCMTIAGCANIYRPFDRVVANDTGLAPSAERIAVYDSFPQSEKSYRIVKRLWIESWLSTFNVPRYASIEAGATDLRNQADALGGDAIVNFGCYGDYRDPPALICNGSVIKYAP
jgi:hypothetical protein